MSYLTYRNAADTSDLKNAVINLTSLASDAHRQADAMQAQAKTMQGQLNQMMEEQRPWITVSEFKFNDITVYPVGAGILIDTSYQVTNLGHSPAIGVFISTTLIFSDRESFDNQSVRRLCNEHPSTDEKLLNGYSDTIVPGQALHLTSYPLQPTLAATFSHRIENLENTGVSGVAADFFLAGCVTYRTLGSETFHHTGFAYKGQGIDVRMPDYPFAKIPFDKGLVKENLIIIPSPYGNFTD